jgi:hypothetical protein
VSRVRIVTVLLVVCGLLAAAGAAVADPPGSGPTLTVKPSSVKSAKGKATFVVSGTNWQDPNLRCNGGPNFVALQLLRGPVTAVRLPRANLKSGSSFSTKVTATVKSGRYNVKGRLGCEAKGGGGTTQDHNVVATTPLTVT